jgi:Resolvase, N terminal domain
MSRAGFGGDPTRVTGQSASDRGGSGAAALMRARTDQGNVVQGAVGYVRVSTLEQASEGVSLDAQRDKLRASCEFNGIESIDIAADPRRRPGLPVAVKSAPLGHRPGYNDQAVM